MRKWIAYMLSALCLMPVGQLSANSNIFRTETVGRHVVVTLNPLLVRKGYYSVWGSGLIGLYSVTAASFCGNGEGQLPPEFCWKQIHSVGAWNSRVALCDGIPDTPLCRGASSYTPLGLTFSGGAIKNAQMTLGLGPTGIQREYVKLRTYPSALVTWRNSTTGLRYISSALQTTDTAFGAFNQERMVESYMVFAEAPLIRMVYTWASAYGGIRACLVNPKTGLPASEGCSLLETSGTFDQLSVTPSYDALIVHTTFGMWFAYKILSDGTLDATAYQVVFDGADAVDAITTTPNPQVAMLSSSTTGKVYACDYPLSPGAGNDIIKVRCNEPQIMYDSSLVGMIRPEFVGAATFVTAVDKTLISCRGSVLGTAAQWAFSCSETVILDQPIISVSSAISHTSLWDSRLRARRVIEADLRVIEADLSFIEADFWVVGLGRMSATYGSNLLVCRTPAGTSGVLGECQQMSTPDEAAAIERVDIF